MAENKTKYKLTSIGQIPYDWNCAKYTDVAELRHGYQFRDYDFVDEGIPVIKIGNLKSGGDIYFDNVTYIDEKRLGEFNAIQLVKGDLLMALSGATIGKVAIIKDDYGPLLQNYRVGAFIPDEKIYNKRFLYYVIQSRYVQSRVENLLNQAAQPNIGKGDFDKIFIPVPPMEEQVKIAQILSTWDTAIENLEQLIAKKERTKKALMQQLLTGKKGFKKYRKVCFTDVAELKHGYQFRDYDFTESGIPVIKIGNLTSGGDLKLDNLSYISDSKLDSFKQFLIEKGDILMALSGATIGKVSYVDFPIDTMLQNYRVGSFKPLHDKIDRMYLYYILQSNYVQLRVLALMNTGAQPNIGIADFDKIFFPLPEILEQKQIASLLTSCDKEIKLLSGQLLHYKNQKQGLMQQLLTGKIRVKV